MRKVRELQRLWRKAAPACCTNRIHLSHELTTANVAESSLTEARRWSSPQAALVTGSRSSLTADRGRHGDLDEVVFSWKNS